MYRCASWPIKKAECQRIGAFELCCLRRLLRVLWAARRSNQSILKEINPEYSLKGLMLKLKLQYFGHGCKELTQWKKPWCWERLRAKGEEGNRGWDVWMTSQTQLAWVWANSGNFVKDREAWCAAVHGGRKELDMTATEQEQENQNIPKMRNRSRWMEMSLGNKGQASSSAGNRDLSVEGKGSRGVEAAPSQIGIFQFLILPFNVLMTWSKPPSPRSLTVLVWIEWELSAPVDFSLGYTLESCGSFKISPDWLNLILLGWDPDSGIV